MKDIGSQNLVDDTYFSLVHHVLNNGKRKSNRTGTDTIDYFSPPESTYDLREGFPILTTKKVHWPSVVHELIWFLKGTEDVKYLEDNKCTIWREWYVKDCFGKDTLPKIYGVQWRKWKKVVTSLVSTLGFTSIQHKETHIDQIANVINEIKVNPDSRRLIVTPWNVGEINDMALPPCHSFMQFNVEFDGENEWLDLKLYQRSNDLGCGTSFNIASYALLLSMIAQVTGKKPRFFIHSYGSAHIYINHLEGLKLQLTRTPFKAPTLKLNPLITDIDDFKFEDCILEGYQHHPFIKFDVAV